MNLDQHVHRLSALVDGWVLRPLRQFFDGLNSEDRFVFFGFLAVAAALGYFLGRRRIARTTGGRTIGDWRLPRFLDTGEARVAHLLLSHFRPPNYHLMNHVTLRVDDGTTQVDHILVSRYGVFVIETKDYNGWIFGDATGPMWTHVYFRQKFKFQNPIFQNYRHVCAVRALLEFLPPDAIKSVVVFTGDAEFKTGTPSGVVAIDQLAAYVAHESAEVMSLNRLQFCVGRLETARLALSRETDVDHVRTLARKFGGRAR